jgi:hypothetical protein
VSNGKGSDPRPFSVSRRTYEANWYRIFGPEARPAPESEPDAWRVVLERPVGMAEAPL